MFENPATDEPWTEKIADKVSAVNASGLSWRHSSNTLELTVEYIQQAILESPNEEEQRDHGEWED